MKTKDGCGELRNEAGILLIRNAAGAKSRNINENKGFIYSCTAP
jgi:hypothetical protein